MLFHTIAQMAIFLESNAIGKENIPRNVDNGTPPRPGKRGKTELSFKYVACLALSVFSDL